MNLLTPFARLARECLLAVQFFTRIPITGRLAAWVGFSPDMLRASAAHFPAVGMLVGAVAAAVYAAALAALPDTPFSPLVAAVLSTVATVMLTGAFHEDGLADVADGLGGSYDKQRALDIMKDSRVGAFGALALVLALLAKVALLALLGSLPVLVLEGDDAVQATSLLSGWLGSFNGADVCMALWAGHVVSRTLPLLLIYGLPHVGDAAASKSKPIADHIGLRRLLIGFLWCFIAIAGVFSTYHAMHLAVASSFAVLALLWMARWFQRRLGGFTGDCLGATQQVCEIAFYLGLAVSQ